MSFPSHTPLSTSLLETAGRRVDDSIDSHRGLGLAVFTVGFFALCFFHSAHVQLTFDEFLTKFIIGFHSPGELWMWLKTGVELNPPLFHILTRASVAVFGMNAAGLRAPAMFGYWTMSVCVWIFLRRRTNALAATVGMLLPMFVTAFEYAFQARPYGIVLGCAGVLLVSWQSAADGVHRRLAMAGIFFSMAVAVSCHYYAVLLFVPIALAEAVRTRISKRFDLGIWAALVGGCAVVLIYVPLIHAGLNVHRNEHVYNRPEFSFPLDAYWILLGRVAALVVVLLVAGAMMFLGRRGRRPEGLRNDEVVAATGFALLPVIGFVAAMTVTNMISDRYVIAMVAGVAILFGAAAFEAFGRRVGLLLPLSLLLVGALPFNQVARLRHENKIFGGFSNPELDSILQSSDVPIAVKPVYWLPFDAYAPVVERQRALCLMDREKLREFGTQDTPETLVTVGQNVLHVPLTEYSSFIGAYPRFFIFGGPVGWLEADVVKRGGSVKIVYQSEANIVFFADLTRSPQAPGKPIGSSSSGEQPKSTNRNSVLSSQ